MYLHRQLMVFLRQCAPITLALGAMSLQAPIAMAASNPVKIMYPADGQEIATQTPIIRFSMPPNKATSRYDLAPVVVLGYAPEMSALPDKSEVFSERAAQCDDPKPLAPFARGLWRCKLQAYDRLDVGPVWARVIVYKRRLPEGLTYREFLSAIKDRERLFELATKLRETRTGIHARSAVTRFNVSEAARRAAVLDPTARVSADRKSITYTATLNLSGGGPATLYTMYGNPRLGREGAYPNLLAFQRSMRQDPGLFTDEYLAPRVVHVVVPSSGTLNVQQTVPLKSSFDYTFKLGRDYFVAALARGKLSKLAEPFPPDGATGAAVVIQ
jgi:hypothetical protein